MSDKATKEQLYELHSAVCQNLTERISDDRATHQDISNAIRFLAANNIAVDLAPKSKLTKVTKIPRLTENELRLA